MKNYILLLFCFGLLQLMGAEKHNTALTVPVELDYNPTDPRPYALWSGINNNVFKSYMWMQQMQMTNGLLESAENTNFISLYDNALASLVFMAQGEIPRAEKIFDFFNSRLTTEFEGNGGGFFQFRDAVGNGGARIWMGDNAWLLIALNHYQSLTGNDRYQNLANSLDTWLRDLQKANGSLEGGTNEDGSEIPAVTEGMITAFIAVKGYDKFHSNLLRFLKRNRWDEENKILRTSSDWHHYQYALDLHSLSSLIFSTFPHNALLDASRFYTSHELGEGKEISGFCFDEDRDVIWYEGTAQMALAYKRKGLKKQAGFLLGELQKGMVNSTFVNSFSGLPYTSKPGTNFGSSKLWPHAHKSAAISSSAWLYFATVNFNPLNQAAAKNIPVKDQFWK